ncbi:PHP domain-containing protein [Phytoactinopolyspora mesophila]|uniref:PHP domain-containing protein n=1 Tax=Phytoactinopolyspora mesophila TaxID=2650750 RepID=A0A7K3M3A2_9ACTN|nr:PHP domain-containing protein [Phytoactinopolyspora mesophila]NDL57392.1 PHP domain-containing protein [Phytoactinopolyspora mesophila]
MLIDLHTHSNVSDGTDLPGDLVRRAHSRGLDVVALTDHDTFDGWAAARDAAAECGIELVPGVEVSTQHRGYGVHLLAYHVNPDYRPLARELARIRIDRRDRLQRISTRLTQAGMPVELSEILALAKGASTVGRPHVADVMVSKGYVKNRDEAFAEWLSYGCLGYVDKYAPDLIDTIGKVHAADGVAVLAHPWGRGSRGLFDRTTLELLAEAGLDGIEVDHQDHSTVEREELRALASDLGLVATGASDYHGRGKNDHELGVNTTAPEEWERLQERVNARGRAERDAGIT